MKSMPSPLFAELVLSARRAAGKRQGEVAQECGISQSYLCKLEKGALPPPAVPRCLLLANALGVDPLLLIRARRPVPPALANLSAEQWLAVWQWLGK